MNTKNNPLASSSSSGHLTEVQFGELLDRPVRVAGSPLSPAEKHLLTCQQCTAELDGLRESLALFRQATTSYADSELRRMPPVSVPARPMVSPVLRSLVLATAAALVVAAFLPMQILHQRSRQATAATANSVTSFQQYANESNEALLQDVDHATSGSLPDSMQALADPMGTTDLSIRKSNPRKD